MRNITMKILTVVSIASLALGGCATATREITRTTPIQEIGAPEWVIKGSGAFGGERGRVFYGVASAWGIQNPSLSRSAAGNRARTELASNVKIYVAALCKDYVASTMAGDVNVTSEEQLTECARKTVTAMELSGSEIVDHWQHPATGELFALARLDLQAFKDTMERMKELDKKLKEYIRENAERLHRQLEKEEEKAKAR